jgi:hypothetical protein
MESGVEFSLDVLEDWKGDSNWDENNLNEFFQAWFEIYS